MATLNTAPTGPAKPYLIVNRRYEVAPSDRPRCPLVPVSERWNVRREGGESPLITNAPYEVACAIARHLNGQDAESGDIEALVCYSLGYCGDRP
jgi:hypothetical protein